MLITTDSTVTCVPCMLEHVWIFAQGRNSTDYNIGVEKTPVTLVRVELHSLGLGVSVSPLVALVSVELHS